jgi:hypothetical protein
MEAEPSRFSTVVRAEQRAAVASIGPFRPGPSSHGQLARMSDCPALPPWPLAYLTPRPTPGRCALSTEIRQGPRRGTPGVAHKSTDSDSGELLGGMSMLSTLTNAPTGRRGWVTTGGCAEGVSIPGGSGSQLAGMSFFQSGTLVLGEPIAIGHGALRVGHAAWAARGRGALDRGTDAAPRDRLRRRLRSYLTPIRVCDPAPVWMAKTKSITRDIAGLLLRASVAPSRADVCRAPLATSGGRP